MKFITVFIAALVLLHTAKCDLSEGCRYGCNTCLETNTSFCTTCFPSNYMSPLIPGGCMCPYTRSGSCIDSIHGYNGTRIETLFGNDTGNLADWSPNTWIRTCNTSTFFVPTMPERYTIWQNLQPQINRWGLPVNSYGITVQFKVYAYLPTSTSWVNLRFALSPNTNDGFEAADGQGFTTHGSNAPPIVNCPIDNFNPNSPTTQYQVATITKSFPNYTFQTLSQIRFENTVNDDSAFAGVSEISAQAFNCSCQGKCRGPGHFQCYYCNDISITPFNDNCLCSSPNTATVVGVTTQPCLQYRIHNCPIGCSKCTLSTSDQMHCFDCLPGFYLYKFPLADGTVVGVCEQMSKPVRTTLTFQYCDPSCSQCYGPSKYECAACPTGSSLVTVKDASHCTTVNTNTTNTTSSGATHLVSTNLPFCTPVNVSSIQCLTINGQFISNAFFGHYASYISPNQNIYIQLVSTIDLCATCFTTEIVISGTNGSRSLPYSVIKSQNGVVPQPQDNKNTFAASFNNSLLTELGCPQSTASDNSTMYTCNVKMYFTQDSQTRSVYTFQFFTYINYMVTGTVITSFTNSTAGNCLDETTTCITNLTNDGNGGTSNTLSLCADAQCTSTKYDNVYYPGESLVIRQSISDLEGLKLTLHKYRITAQMSGGATILDLTESTTEDARLLLTLYTLPVDGLSGMVTITVTSIISNYVAASTGEGGATGGRRLLTGNSSDAASYVNQQRTMNMNIEVRTTGSRDSGNAPSGFNWLPLAIALPIGVVIIMMAIAVFIKYRKNKNRTKGSSDQNNEGAANDEEKAKNLPDPIDFMIGGIGDDVQSNTPTPTPSDGKMTPDQSPDEGDKDGIRVIQESEAPMNQV